MTMYTALLFIAFLCGSAQVSDAFVTSGSVKLASRTTSDHQYTRQGQDGSLCTLLHGSGSSTGGYDSNDIKEEAERLLERAREIRSTIPDAAGEETEGKKKQNVATATSTANQAASEWQVKEVNGEHRGHGYRLYIDIGREEGTWMDQRWGSGGGRIELTLDVVFDDQSPAGPELQELMVKDNFGGKSSATFAMIPAEKARLREGFDQMKTTGKAAYRLDQARNGGVTARFFIDVAGTPEGSRSYGDLSIPKGCLYFSLPCFGGVSRLSSKEGIVTVRQMGWNTGFRREESRIVGTFTAVPIKEATRMDRY
eukprot:CAMPEP_0194028052 /NCGR_PEP_ID=MMETSP0009_2-20130614/2078_1 /TAXON_ID=210454 /ORGANISM="Grammatophora oceanica, Strain CCMP 410" /LENGTH=310 /DNA_ID=CAMNT_0038667303 /DNA_START=49 /DNA_END=981 /DNA_ORIENTATION=-